MDTKCLKCVFAEWEGNKQAGCKFDRLEKFEQQGAIVTLEDNHEKLYARIVGRICNTCRDISAVEKIPARKWMQEVRKEVIPRIAMAVYVENNNQIIEAYRSLRSIQNQTIQPYEIILIYNVNGQEAPAEYMIWFTSFVNHLRWRIQRIIEPSDYGTAIDLTVKSDEMKAVYFTVCKAGYEYPPEYIEVIDKAINDELIRFVALLPDDEGNGLFLQRGLHNFLQGHKDMPIINKIEEIAWEEGARHMIKRFEDLVQ